MTATTWWRVVAGLAASQHGAFHRSQAAESTISAKQLRNAVSRGELRRPLSDVFVVAATRRTWRQRLMVLSLAGAVISARAAAGLHGLDGFAEGKLEVLVERRRERQFPRLVQVHRTAIVDEQDVVVVDGIRTTSIARTLVDLAQVVPTRRVESALDAGLRQGVSLAEIEATVERLWRPGPTGLGPLRDLLADPARSGRVSDSLFERLVERLLADERIAPPIRQYEIPIAGGVRRVDLAWPDARVAVEAHSKRWHFGRRAEEDDNRRDIELAAAGWEVLYITWKMAQEPDFFLRHLRTVLGRAHSAARTVS